MSGPYPERVEWRRECNACEGEGKSDHPFLQGAYGGSHAIDPPEPAVVDCENCGGSGYVWTDEPVTLAQCRPGPFLFDGQLGFKTEYGATTVDENGAAMSGHLVRWVVTNRPDAYVMESGEFFWGGASTHEDREKLLVWPVEELAIVEVPK